MAKQALPKKIVAVSDTALLWCLGLGAFLIYVNTVTHGFVLDDVAVITNNNFVKNGTSGLPDIFSSFYWQGFWNQNTGLYRPLSLAMFALEWQFMPNSPFIHHLISVLLYALTAVLLFKFLLKLLPATEKWILFFITLLFIVHPVHTEVVANIKSRDEILSFLFFILTGWVVIEDKFSGYKYLLLSAFLFLMALFSKEAAITFLPIYGLMLYFFKGLNLKKIVIRLIPLVSLGVLWLALRYYVTHFQSPPLMSLTYQDNSLLAIPDLITRVATAIGIFGQYIIQSFYPFDMSYDYSFNQYPAIALSNLWVWITILLVSGGIYWGWQNRKTHPLIFFGILFFLISFSVSSNLFIIIGTTRADRLLYTPILGLLIMSVYLLFRYTSLTVAKYACVIIACIFSFKTYTRNKDWKSNDTLFAADIQSAPNSSRVNYNYGTSLLNNLPADETEKQSQVNEVIRYLNNAITIDSNERNAYANLAVAYYKKKDYSSSINASRKAISFNREDYSLYGNLADALFMNKSYDSALYYYKICEDHNIIYDYTYNFMGVACFQKQDYETAAQHFEKGVKLFPNYAETWLNYGNTLAVLKKFIPAIAAFEKSYSLNSTNKQPLYYIAISYENLGDKSKAREYMDRYQKQ